MSASLVSPPRTCAIGLVLALVPVPVRAATINLLDVRVDTTARGVVRVEEHIDIDYGAASYSGFTRELPRGPGAPALVVRSVTDAAGQSMSFTTTAVAGALRVDIAHPGGLVSGPARYVVSYDALGGITAHTDHTELSWSATRGTVPLPVDHVRVSIGVPSAASTDLTPTCAADGVACRVEFAGGRVVATADELRAGDDMRVRVAAPLGTFALPGETTGLLFRLAPYAAPWMLPPVLLALVIAVLWTRAWLLTRPMFSADDAVAALLAPAVAELLARRKVTLDGVAATVLALAERGHLTIAPTRGRLALGLSTRGYTLTRTLSAKDRLRPFESGLLDAIFDLSNRVDILSLRSKLWKDVERFARDVARHAAHEDEVLLWAPDAMASRSSLAAVAAGVLGLVALWLDAPSAAEIAFAAAVCAVAARWLLPPWSGRGLAARAQLERAMGAHPRADIPLSLAIITRTVGPLRTLAPRTPPPWWRGDAGWWEDAGDFVRVLGAIGAPPAIGPRPGGRAR